MSRLTRKTPLASRNKYRAKRQEYGGYRYDSRIEAQWAYNLDMLKRAGEIQDWDRQYRVDMTAYDKHGNPAITMSHKVDFRVHENDGSYTLLEVKGFETTDYRTRRKWLEKLWLRENPNYRYQVVKEGQGFRGFAE